MSILQEKVDASGYGNGLPELLEFYPVSGMESTQMSREQRAVDNGNRDHVYAGIFRCFDIKLDT